MVVQRFKPGATGTHIDDIPVILVDLNPVPDLEWFIDGDNCAAKEIGDNILCSKCNGKTGDPGTRKERGNIHLECIEDQDDRGKPDCIFCHELEQLDEPVIPVPFRLFRDRVPVDDDNIVNKCRYDLGADENVKRVYETVIKEPLVLGWNDAEILEGNIY